MINMFKKKTNGSWSNIKTVKRKTNGAWEDCSIVQKKINGVWSPVWEKILLDFTLYRTPTYFSPTDFTDMTAKTVKDGNIIITSGGGYYAPSPDFMCINVAHKLSLGEIIYIDYSFTTKFSLTDNNGNYIYPDDTLFYARICFGGVASNGYIYPYGNIKNTSSQNIIGTISGTANGVFDNESYPWLILGIYRNTSVSYVRYSSAELKISKIYSDSKIYYWDNKTIV